MSNLTTILVHGGSAHQNKGAVAARAYAAGEIEPNAESGVDIVDAAYAVGDVWAVALSDGGSVVKVVNPDYDAGGAATVLYNEGEDIYAERTTPGSAYNVDTNPYSTVNTTAGIGQVYFGRVDRDASALDQYIRIRPMRAEFDGNA